MNLSLQMFLLAAEELNFTKAAKKAFITQQCLSSHIKKLETAYGVELFIRRPTLKLSPAGEALYKKAKNLEVYEKAIEKEMLHIANEEQGTITLGINTTRARILLPKLIALFHQTYPSVNISIVLDDVVNLVPLLKAGKLDLFLGVDCVTDEMLAVTPLALEEAYLVGKKSTLLKHLIDPSAIEDINNKIIDLRKFKKLPIVKNKKGSTFSYLINEYLKTINITIDPILSVSDYEVQIDTCSYSGFLSFCPQIALDVVLHNNHHFIDSGLEPLEIYKLKDLTRQLRIDLITHKDAYISKYQQYFMDLLKAHLQEKLEEIHNAI